MATEKLRYVVTANTKGFKDIAKFGKLAGAAVVAALAASIKISAEFEKQLSKLRAVSGGTAKEMKKLADQARALGRTTAFTATEALKLQVELAKLGFTSKEILQSSGGILDLAAALGVELSDAATLAGSSIRAFGLATTETGRVADVLAKATASSALDFSKLTESMKDAAPIAKLYNFTIEDTVAMLGELANAGIHGSKAGTSLRNVFLELDKKGVTLAEAFKQVNESANPAATALDLVGKRSAAALAILAQNEGAVQGLADELYDSVGAANEMRKVMEDNLIGDFDKFKSAVSAAGESIGNDLTPLTRQFVQYMTKVVNSGILLDIWDNMRIIILDVGIVILEFGLAMDKVAYGISKGPFGTGTGDSSILKRIVQATNALDDFIKKRDELRAKDNSSPIELDPLQRVVAKKTKNTVGDKGEGRGIGTLQGPKVSGVVDAGPGITTSGDLGADEAMKKREAAAQSLIATLNRLEATNSLVSDSFTTLGNNIASSMTQSMGVAGAFFGTMIQGLLDLAAQAIISAITTQTTEAVKQGAMVTTAATDVATSGVVVAAEGVKQAAYATTAIAAGVAGAAEGAAAGGPAAPVLLPIFIAAALAAIGAALSGIGGSKGGGASASSASASSPTATTTTPKSVQRSGGGGQLVATVRGQDLRFVLQGANDSYQAIN